MLADGLGHGTHANQLVNGLKDQLDWIDKRSNERSSLDRCIREMHKKLRKSDQHHQVAAGLIEIDTSAQRIAAIIPGNTHAYVLRDDREEGGLGLFFAKDMADQSCYERKLDWNRLRLTITREAEEEA